MKGWIYKIVQIRNDDIPWFEGICYIGQHRNSPLKKRWQKHKNDARKYDPTKKGRGSKFAIGKPDFRKTANYKPVFFHSTQEIFVSQKEFCETFGFKDYDVSELLKKGKTPEEVRNIILGKIQ